MNIVYQNLPAAFNLRAVNYKLTAQFVILEIERKDKNQTFNKHFEGGDNTEKTEESLFS